MKKTLSSKWDEFWGKKYPERPYIPAGFSKMNKTGKWKIRRPVYKDVDKCTSCDLCWIFCPDGLIKRARLGVYVIDYEYCKGCGICAEECPHGVIEMVKDIHL